MKFRNVALRYHSADKGGASGGAKDKTPSSTEDENGDKLPPEVFRSFETEEDFKKETRSLIDSALKAQKKEQAATQEKAIAEAVAEALRKAKLSPEDQKTEEQKAQEAKLAKLEAENLQLKLTKSATEQLAKTSISQELLEDSLVILGPSMVDEEAVERAVKSLEALVKTAVDKAVKAEREKILNESDGDPGGRGGKDSDEAAAEAYINSISGTRNTKSTIFD